MDGDSFFFGQLDCRGGVLVYGGRESEKMFGLHRDAVHCQPVHLLIPHWTSLLAGVVGSSVHKPRHHVRLRGVALHEARNAGDPNYKSIRTRESQKRLGERSDFKRLVQQFEVYDEDQLKWSNTSFSGSINYSIK